MKKYSFWIGLRKTLINFVLFGFPLFVQLLPTDFLNLTVGGLLYMFVNYAKVKWAEGTPNQ